MSFAKKIKKAIITSMPTAFAVGGTALIVSAKRDTTNNGFSLKAASKAAVGGLLAFGGTLGVYGQITSKWSKNRQTEVENELGEKNKEASKVAPEEVRTSHVNANTANKHEGTVVYDGQGVHSIKSKVDYKPSEAQVAFQRLFDLADKVELNADAFDNGTGYFNQMVTADLTAFNSGLISTTDSAGRRVVVITNHETYQEEGHQIIFERYAPGNDGERSSLIVAQRLGNRHDKSTNSRRTLFCEPASAALILQLVGLIEAGQLDH